jgi:tRNA 2-thiouridine synthesizing protein A
MTIDTWLDERGRRCPLPVLALMRAVQSHDPGVVVAVISDDPAAEHDIPAWCRLKGATLIERIAPPDGGAGSAFVVRLPGGPAAESVDVE